MENGAKPEREWSMDGGAVLAAGALLCEGHLLIEDVPGIGKTMLAKALARAVGCTFRRVQCTPDLLPSDITGLFFFNQRTQAFEFRQGPVFAQVVLADEINRATPRTQSALLEAMQERRKIHAGEAGEEYVIALAAETRRHPEIELGMSPRATLALYHAAQAHAA